ncbi:MAG: rod shape-determining protein MreC [Lewinellaceae bacterium]|nr:rod shape-determining protein MreC [Lewinellaceae bacterium]
MRNLLLLFIRNGGFVTFMLLEVVCFSLIVNFNEGQNAIYSYNAARVGGQIMLWRQSAAQYFHLRERADSLAQQNAALQTNLYNLRNERVARRDTQNITLPDSLSGTIVRPQFEFIAAVVLSNSVSMRNNWLIIDRGSEEGISPNMGVLCPDGVVGTTRHVSPHFSMVMSILNPQTKISASLSSSGYFGSLVWEGSDPAFMLLRDIPKHAVVKEGEAIYTSGYSILFPKGILIGYAGKPSLKPGSNFYEIPVRLAHNPATTNDVYVVKSIFYSELKDLQEQEAADEQ